MATAAQVVNKALSYKGMGRSTFSTAFYGYDNTSAWCVVFVWYVFRQLGISNLFCGGVNTAYCGYVLDYYRNLGRFYQTPAVGDLVIYSWNDNNNEPYDHIGIVTNFDSNYIYTIEGNISGGIVDTKTRVRDSQILGFCRPAYDGATSGGSTGNSGGTTTYPTLSSGSSGSDVKEMQKKLLLLHYDCGSAGADGDFGSGTLAAVKAFQSANGLTVDGVCGPNTHAKLNSKYNALGVFTAVCNLADLKVRTGDSTNYAIFSSYPKLAKGEEVLVAETTANNWYFALVGNRYAAYMAAKYMKIA